MAAAKPAVLPALLITHHLARSSYEYMNYRQVVKLFCRTSEHSTLLTRVEHVTRVPIRLIYLDAGFINDGFVHREVAFDFITKLCGCCVCRFDPGGKQLGFDRGIL